MYISGSRTSDSAMLGDSSQPVGRPPTQRHQHRKLHVVGRQPTDMSTARRRQLDVCLSVCLDNGTDQSKFGELITKQPTPTGVLLFWFYEVHTQHRSQQRAISASATRNTGVSKQRACRLTQEHTGIWERFSGACLFKIPRWPTWPQAQLCTALLLRAGPVVESRQSCRCVHRAEPPLAMAMRQAAATSMRRVPF